MFRAVLRGLLFCCSLLMLVGCSQSTGFRSASENDKFCEICTFNGKAAMILLVADSEGSSAQTAPIPTYEGNFQLTNGDTIAWSCETNNGRSGFVSIEFEKFELGNGNWFRVYQSEGELQVVQFEVNTNAFDEQMNRSEIFPRLRELAEKNDEIAAFLE